ncbi:MAG TPA: hypothetical protein P5149_08280 [Candidatus Competibacteraceae bacterium]|nr:hypothetical protein [Candidatus Competibacteraceae bacterium]
MFWRSFSVPDFDEAGHRLAWRLRHTLSWSPPVIRWPRTLPALMRTLPSAQRAAAEILATRYDLRHWASVCDPIGFHESVYVLDVLDRYAGFPGYPAPYLDIGCKNGGYLPGLQTWSGSPWHGVELDAYRRYWTLTTRRAHGEFVARSLPGCRYIAGDLLDVRGSYGFITWFLPFLHEAPLKIWGLPRQFLRPLDLLVHAWTLLAPGGCLLVVNQGEAEAARQHLLFQELGIAAQALGRVESSLSPFQKPRFGWRADKR